jgi:hypothetical protein
MEYCERFERIEFMRVTAASRFGGESIKTGFVRVRFSTESRWITEEHLRVWVEREFWNIYGAVRDITFR